MQGGILQQRGEESEVDGLLVEDPLAGLVPLDVLPKLPGKRCARASPRGEPLRRAPVINTLQGSTR